MAADIYIEERSDYQRQGSGEEYYSVFTHFLFPYSSNCGTAGPSYHI